ncbi:MAG: DNA replication/repair protein RecF [Armatimonadetes bacterium]|nr:DNA replication/repair protein RecF [Armatimonadota bacterium]
MWIRSLSLTNFRNYAELELSPSQEINILLGGNAQGKSAVLEAIYLLATSKSHRTARDTDMIRINNEHARASADVSRSQRPEVTLEIVLSRSDKKLVRIDKVKRDRVGELIGQLNAVIFSGLDVEMVKGEPSLRRRFMDMEISQTSPSYIYAMARYKRTLEQRNSLLRDIKAGKASDHVLEAWDAQLSAYGAAMMVRRERFVAFIASRAKAIYYDLSGGAEELSVSYKPTVECGDEDETRARLKEALLARRDTDISRGVTSVGPHRDDVSILVSGLPARDYASQGQQRSAAVALKLAEVDLMREATSESPVVLLDDVGAELDPGRRARIIELVAGRCQTFVTTTRLEEIISAGLDSATVFEVRSGKVMRQ